MRLRLIFPCWLLKEEGMGDRLNEKVALISGAGSSGPGWGNGKATAVLFAREGAKVVAADIKLDAALRRGRSALHNIGGPAPYGTPNGKTQTV
jgi:NAD(P)-dependent dehydrogenase (short-subunit alcohol dehydrogenase family)